MLSGVEQNVSIFLCVQNNVAVSSFSFAKCDVKKKKKHDIGGVLLKMQIGATYMLYGERNMKKSILSPDRCFKMNSNQSAPTLKCFSGNLVSKTLWSTVSFLLQNVLVGGPALKS